MTEHVTHEDVVAFAERYVNLPSDDAKAGRKRVQNLRDRLERYIADNSDFDLVKMLHAGSVAKGTALRTLNDMDVAVYVEQADAPDDRDLVNWLTERLREAYDGVLKPEQITPGHHCVHVSFRSEGGLDVDVVPVLYEGEADDVGYLISRETGERLKTSVRLHLDFVVRRKTAHPDDFAQVVRFVKWWVRQQQRADESFRFKSFMVELVVASLADHGTVMKPYPEALRAVFGYIVKSGLRERIAFTDCYPSSRLPARTAPIEVFDPVNPANNVAFLYDDSDRKRIVDAAEEALDALTEATFATTKPQAVDCYRVVLGPSFRA
jgi:tRNA nucleotidyltransferase (CCA-adding enzyme)